MNQTFAEFCDFEDMRTTALGVVSAHERGHGSFPGPPIDCAYNVLALLDRLGHPRCSPAAISGFVASEQEYNVFVDAEGPGNG